MPVSADLTPAAVALTDYEIAQGPALGGEREVWLSAGNSLLLGIARLTADATVTYEYVNTPILSAGVPTSPLVAFVLTELKATAAAVITYAGLTATLTPVGYAQNQSFNFGATRGVELIGTSTTIDATIVPTISNAKRGAQVALVQMPLRSTFVKVGSTTSKDITVPTKTSKSVSDGMLTTRYNKPGKTSEGRLKITAHDIGDDDGLNRFRGIKCVAMVETKKEEVLVTSRAFFTSFVCGQDVTNPDADGEAMLQCEGTFQFMITLVAAGS